MDQFGVGVPWGLLRIESVGSTIGIPEKDPEGSPVDSHEECVVVTVVHGDIGPVDVGVSLDDGEDEGTCVFDGVLRVLDDGIEVADIVGEDFRRHYPVPRGPARLRIWLDNPEEAQRVRIRLTTE
ncbi:hypothetical protein [Amycolatopsis sp. NPDC059021]|uniref:hypothetical protein n=1 Tax=Amycolatopsis sp. NPDC059021 TaxID=3346704 RepID=UPI00366C2AAF